MSGPPLSTTSGRGSADRPGRPYQARHGQQDATRDRDHPRQHGIGGQGVDHDRIEQWAPRPRAAEHAVGQQGHPNPHGQQDQADQRDEPPVGTRGARNGRPGPAAQAGVARPGAGVVGPGLVRSMLNATPSCFRTDTPTRGRRRSGSSSSRSLTRPTSTSRRSVARRATPGISPSPAGLDAVTEADTTSLDSRTRVPTRRRELLAARRDRHVRRRRLHPARRCGRAGAVPRSSTTGRPRRRRSRCRHRASFHDRLASEAIQSGHGTRRPPCMPGCTDAATTSITTTMSPLSLGEVEARPEGVRGRRNRMRMLPPTSRGRGPGPPPRAGR